MACLRQAEPEKMENSMRPFEGKVALVTGGSSGLGAATALQFAREGARVVIAARRTEQSESVLQQITALGGEALFVRTDVSRAVDVAAMVQATLDRFGRLDCAVNNAGVSGTVGKPVADVKEAGAIVNVASIYGIKPSDLGHATYSASKFGVVGLTQSAAIDYGQRGLRINAVAPGFTRSEMVNPDAPASAERYKVIAAKHSAMNRLGHAEEIASAITWLCSDAARFVNGTVLPVDGGATSRLY